MMTPEQDKARRRNRTMLLVIFGLFFGGMLIAGVLRFSGWRPEGMKNKGEMLQPYIDLREYSPELSAGGSYHWNESPRTWRMVVAPTACDGARREPCGKLLHQLDTVWQLMGKDADRVHVLWIGEPPAGVAMPPEVRVVRRDAVFPAQLPQGNETTGSQGGDAAWLVDPNGFVVLRYAPGFDPGDLRSDVARLLKVN